MTTPVPAELDPTVSRWLTGFQDDIKTFLRVVYDDQELDDELHAQATATVLYALAPGDVIPDSMGPLGYVDDALALRILVEETRLRAPERFATYGERMPEIIEPLADDIAISKEWLGDLYEAFRARILQTDKIEYKGKRVRDTISDPEFLEDELSLATVKMDFKPTDVRSAIGKLATVPGIFRAKLTPKQR